MRVDRRSSQSDDCGIRREPRHGGTLRRNLRPAAPLLPRALNKVTCSPAINGLPLMRSSGFAEIISMLAPGASVYFDTWRNGEAMQVTVIVCLGKWQTSG